MADKTLGFDWNTRFNPPSTPTTIEIDCSKYKQSDSQPQQKSGSDFDKF
jgi:hypothetical protein